jgi:uncharacterized protein YlxP (DUF503 family)
VKGSIGRWAADCFSSLSQKRKARVSVLRAAVEALEQRFLLSISGAQPVNFTATANPKGSANSKMFSLL